MKFCTVALAHTAGEVREKAEKIIVALYKDRGSPVKNFLPPDDDKTRKNVLYKQLFEAFDRIDGKPTKQELRVSVSALMAHFHCQTRILIWTWTQIPVLCRYYGNGIRI